MLLVNAMVLIGTLGTFESNEAFSPSPEKIEKLIEKHPDRIQTDNTEELRQYATDLTKIVESDDSLLANSYEVQNLLRKIIYIVCGCNLIVIALATATLGKTNKP